VTEDVCHVLGNEVAVLGDSYIDLSGDFTTLLQNHARSAGALGASDTYIDFALSGASMAPPKTGEPLVPTIPTQFPDAVAEAKKRGSKGIKVVIMTGGGNDVLINERSCLEKESVAVRRRAERGGQGHRLLLLPAPSGVVAARLAREGQQAQQHARLLPAARA
jgi:hypothetical protein